MSSSPPPEKPSTGLRRRLKLRVRQTAVIDGEARLMGERPQRPDPVIFLYDLYERAAVPFGLACVALGVLCGAIGLLLSGSAARP